MTTASASRTARTIGRARKLWGELGYAQRRLLEIRTGVSIITPEERRRSRLRVNQLEYLYRS